MLLIISHMALFLCKTDILLINSQQDFSLIIEVKQFRVCPMAILHYFDSTLYMVESFIDKLVHMGRSMKSKGGGCLVMIE